MRALRVDGLDAVAKLKSEKSGRALGLSVASAIASLYTMEDLPA